MARARNIKPSLFKNEVLGVADPLLTILFEGLWCLADCNGVLEDRPLRIKAEIFPYREISDLNIFLQELEMMGFITRYSHAKTALIQVNKFIEHQKPHPTEKGSGYPVFIEADGISDLNAKKNGDILFKQPSSLNEEPLSEEGSKEPLPEKKSDDVGLIFGYWQTALNHPSSKLTNDRRGKLKARIKEGYSLEQICSAIDGCKNSPYHMGDNDQGKVYDDIELICRTGSQLEKFIGYNDRKQGNNGNGTNRQNNTNDQPSKATSVSRLAETANVINQYPTEAELRDRKGAS